MIVKAWNNLVKYLLRRWLFWPAAVIRSAYQMGIRCLRKLTPRVIRFRWLQNLINHLLPCPQMVQRFIDPELGIDGFFAALNRRGIRYAVLRWFESLPHLSQGDDIDMLVDDDDLAKIKDLFVALPTGISCDIYSVSAVDGASYRRHVPYYPPRLAREILENSVMFKEICRVPDPRRHFLSLAYHAVYHKAEESGLPRTNRETAAPAEDGHSYADAITRLGKVCGIPIVPRLENLHQLLTELGWAPRPDVLRAISHGSEWLTGLAAEDRGGASRPSNIVYPFDVHGVRVMVESNSETFVDYVSRDFCFFHEPKKEIDRPHVHIRFLNQTPPWEEIPAGATPLFKTTASTVYKQGPNRYVDHNREVLSVYDLEGDQGTVYSDDVDAMYRIAYALLMTRIGMRLDAAGRHRLHALGISLEDQAVLFLGEGGTGKTTLGLELMKHSRVGWLTDDILAVDRNGRALAFPTSPRLVEGSAVPWLPASVKLLKAPMPKEPPKVQLPASSILDRVSPSARLGAMFLCRRRSGVGPAIGKAGFLEALSGICRNALTGKEFGHMMAYHLRFAPAYFLRMAAAYCSRMRTFVYLAWTVPIFRFEMGENISENASLILNFHPSATGNETFGAIKELDDSMSTDSRALKNDARENPPN